MNSESELQKCICGSTNITTHHKIGHDVDEEGSEEQHVDVCDNCKAWRFNIDRSQNWSTLIKRYGKWETVGSVGYDFIDQLFL